MPGSPPSPALSALAPLRGAGQAESPPARTPLPLSSRAPAAQPSAAAHRAAAASILPGSVGVRGAPGWLHRPAPCEWPESSCRARGEGAGRGRPPGRRGRARLSPYAGRRRQRRRRPPGQSPGTGPAALVARLSAAGNCLSRCGAHAKPTPLPAASIRNSPLCRTSHTSSLLHVAPRSSFRPSLSHT